MVNTNGIHIPKRSRHPQEGSQDDQPGSQATLRILRPLIILTDSPGSRRSSPVLLLVLNRAIQALGACWIVWRACRPRVRPLRHQDIRELLGADGAREFGSWSWRAAFGFCAHPPRWEDILFDFSPRIRCSNPGARRVQSPVTYILYTEKREIRTAWQKAIYRYGIGYPTGGLHGNI